jgi:hypothetical protein
MTTEINGALASNGCDARAEAAAACAQASVSQINAASAALDKVRADIGKAAQLDAARLAQAKALAAQAAVLADDARKMSPASSQGSFTAALKGALSKAGCAAADLENADCSKAGSAQLTTLDSDLKSLLKTYNENQVKQSAGDYGSTIQNMNEVESIIRQAAITAAQRAELYGELNNFRDDVAARKFSPASAYMQSTNMIHNVEAEIRALHP